jgi:BirA family biotin operon repressor/biotin-[acetyl-CoA-carboxylase] ligase
MYKERILNLLRSSKTGFVSGEALALKLGISRTMVWKHIKSLEREGFGIEAVPSQGYRITTVPDLLRVSDVRQGLKTKLIGREIVLLPETESTNTVAMNLASQGAREGAVVLAEVQTGGRGRLGRKWISPKGNLYMSVILRPGIPTHKAPLITLMGAVAVASAMRSCCGLPAGIKWPNDILVSGKKAGGLLTEMSAEPDRIKHIVLGIGVNVNMDLVGMPADIRPITTTLAAEAGSGVNRTELLRQLLRELEQWYRVFLKSDADVLALWEALNVTTGKRVSVGGQGETFSGVAQGIDVEGRLIVRLDDGSTRTVAAGDVTIVKR